MKSINLDMLDESFINDLLFFADDHMDKLHENWRSSDKIKCTFCHAEVYARNCGAQEPLKHRDDCLGKRIKLLFGEG